MEAWRSAPLETATTPPPAVVQGASAFSETQGGAVTGRAPPKRKPQSTEPGFQEAWRTAPVVEATADEKARAFSQGAVGAGLESAGVVGGMMVGGKLGALGGPASPVTVPAGMALGAGAGYLLGKGARSAASNVDFMGQPVTTSVESMPPEQRPFGYAGEVVGAAGIIAGGVARTAAEGARTGGAFIDRILEFAGKNPGTFAASEAVGAGGAAVGSAVSESYLPGKTAPRIAAEVAGGFFNPSRLTIGAARGAVDAVKTAIGSMSQAGREGRAAKALQDIVLQSGEDPVALAKALRESTVLNVTAAQKTGSPALIALEARLSQESGKFGAESRRKADEGLGAIKDMIVALRGSGDPSAVRAAAELQDRYFRTVIAGRIQIAEQSAVEAASRITRDSPQTRSLLAKQANELLGESIREVRTVESELWDAVPKNVKATAEEIIKRHSRIRNEMLPEEKMPEVVEGFVQRMKTDGATNSGELIRFRSRALALAREASAQGHANDARIYGSLAEAALDDLGRLSKTTIGSDLSGVPGQLTGLDEARAFSRELNETFTRTFAGDAMATKVTGADRIPPELMLRRALGAGKEAGEVRLRELEKAMRFLPDKGLGGPEAQQALDFMLDAQQRILRLSASEAIDPLTGRVSPTRVARFMDNNAELLERFPEVKSTLQGALKSEVNAQQVQHIAEGAQRIVERQAAFSRVLKTDSASDAIKKALAGDRPESEIVALARLAKGRGGGAEAVDGLKVAVWDNAIRRSSDATGAVSFERLSAELFQELRPGLPPLANILQKEGVLTAGEISKAQEFIRQAQTIQVALERGTNVEKILQNPDAMVDLVLRVAGAKFGAAMSAMGPGGSGASLIAASRGSSFARQVFDKVPQSRVRDVLIQAALDPRFAAMLLEKPATPAQGIRLARQIHAYILQTGITGQDGDD